MANGVALRLPLAPWPCRRARNQLRPPLVTLFAPAPHVPADCPRPEFREILLTIWVEAHFSKFLAEFGGPSSAPFLTVIFGKFHVLIPKWRGRFSLTDFLS